MTSDWYCLIDNREYGPLDAQKLHQLARSGQLSEADLVRKGADGNWGTAKKVRGLFPDDASSAPGSDAPPPVRTEVAPSISQRRAPSRFAALLAIAVLFAIFAAIGIAFDVGRRSAEQPIVDDAPSQSVSAPTTAAQVVKNDNPLPLVEANLQPASAAVDATTAAGKEIAAVDGAKQQATAEPSSLPADRQSDPAAAVRRVVADAEKSVASIEVDGYTNESDGAGSGFLIGRNILVTNYHVIEGGKTIRVTFPDGRKVDALGWLAIDRNKDLALIACDSGDLQPIKLAASRPNKLDVVFALGSPLGLSGTISNGIVSGIRSGQELGKDVVLIQSTAAISPGNSGGPLLNEKGEVVGVTSLFLKGGQNLNFAVAAEHVAEILASADVKPQPWVKLPLPPLKHFAEPSAGETRQRQLADEAAKKLAESFANAIKSTQEKHDQNQATQGELNRIVARAGDITKALSVIEAEGTALTEHRNQVMATGDGIITHGQDVEAQLEQLQLAFQAAEIRLHRAIRDGLADQIGILQVQIAQLQPQVANLNQEYSSLKASAIALDRQARDLAQQIAYKAAQRDQLVQVLNLLRQQYDTIRGQ